MSASKGYIPRTFLQRLGVSKARPAWFVLFLAAVTTAAIWAGALILFLLLTQLFVTDNPGPISSWGPLNWLGGFLLLWDMAVLWYHVVYLVGYKLGSWDDDRVVERRLEVWGSPIFMLLAFTAWLLWLVIKYVAAPMPPLVLPSLLGLDRSITEPLLITVLLYPVAILLLYAARSLVMRARRGGQAA